MKMTLVMGIRCTNGVVVAADSASTDLDGGTKQATTKIHQVGQLPMLVGTSGDIGLIQKVREALVDAASSLGNKGTLKSLRQELRRFHAAEMKESNNYYVPQPGLPYNAPAAVLLIIGVLKGEPYVIEIDQTATDTNYDMSMGGFYAIGSGKTIAQALFRPHLFNTETRTLEVGKVLAHRVLSDAIDLASMFLAHPISMYTVSLDGSIRSVDTDELKALESTCSVWRELESDSLKSALRGPTEPVPVAQIPVPSP